MIEYYGTDGALQLYDRFDSPALQTILHESWQLKRDPKDKQQEERAKKSTELNNWLKNTSLNDVVITQAEGNGRMLTLEQINNFEF